FGTDQSQVGRYLTGSSVRESRMGLLMNGLLKVPMQFCILLIGILVFAYYQYNTPPLFFNSLETKKLEESAYNDAYQQILKQQEVLAQEKKEIIYDLTASIDQGNEAQINLDREKLVALNAQADELRTDVIDLIKQNNPNADTNDNNYIFLSFVTSTFPKGFIGLLIAIIMLASMGATASAINSLASTTVVDIYKRFINKQASEKRYLAASRISTIGWGIFTVVIALYSSKLGNLLEAVNILGSLFYGTILGIFLVAFYVKRVGGKAVFWAAVISEILVIWIWTLDVVAFLWLNLIGCVLVIFIGLIVQASLPKATKKIGV